MQFILPSWNNFKCRVVRILTICRIIAYCAYASIIAIEPPHCHRRAIKNFIYDDARVANFSCIRDGNASIINAIDGVGGLNLGHGAQELVTGGRDGCVRVWDPRVPEPVLMLLNGDEYKHAEPILHSRAHLVKKLEIMQATGQVA